MSTSQHEKAGDVQDIVCNQCQTSNPVERRYCGRCGQRLWEPCAVCETPNASDMVFCGSCGTGLQEAFEQRRSQLLATMTTVGALREEGRYSEALTLLKEVRGNGDTRLDEIVRDAKGKLESLQEERDAKARDATERHARAVELLAEHQYAAVERLLQAIPLGLRNREVTALLQDVGKILAEIQTLTEKIREASRNKSWDEMLPTITRLLELRPHDEKLQRMATQLEDRQRKNTSSTTEQTLARAKQLYTQGQYLAADDLLEEVAEEHIAPAHRTIYDTIREVGWLVRELKRAPFVQPYLLHAAERWKKYRPADADATRLETELRKRLAVPNSDPRFARRWAKAPAQTALDATIDWWQRTKTAEWSPENDEAASCSSSRFLAAYGLALQGLGRATVPLDLTPVAGKSFLPKLGLLARTAAPNEVWGLDFGTTGLKSLQLVQDGPRGTLDVRATHFIPYDTPLLDASGEEPQRTILRTAVETWLERAELQTAAVVLGFSGPRSLSRNFEIPLIKGKKAADAVAYEARMQIPIPLDQIVYAWHAWPATSDPTAANFQEISLLAARREHVQQPLDACSGLPLKILGINSVCVALYNAAIQEFFADHASADKAAPSTSGAKPPTTVPDESSRGPCLAILELGADASNLVVAGPSFMRFRSIQLGTHRLDRNLMTSLTLTRAQTHQLREQPARARWMYSIDNHVKHAYDELMREVRRTLRTFASEGIQVERMLVTGGGAEQLGLLRLLVHGL